MDAIIRFVIADVPTWAPIAAIVLAIFSAMRLKHKGQKHILADRLFAYLLLFAVGIQGVWAFIMHAYFPDLAANFIGWLQSPFQFEVAAANLGFGVIGILAFSSNLSFRAATVFSFSCFAIGAAAEHIIQLYGHGNHAPDNAGVILYTDVAIPVVLLILLAIQWKVERKANRGVEAKSSSDE
ncbi:MAG: hypothetical protein CMF50_00185 [Legionellales bacterium]|nr:hypothetical protein [Legionellales bacterium]|tara:strand:+ start:2456 stop:3001 length:546 start_codon:yes stop_codon:yes gene_type:complete